MPTHLFLIFLSVLLLSSSGHAQNQERYVVADSGPSLLIDVENLDLSTMQKNIQREKYRQGSRDRIISAFKTLAICLSIYLCWHFQTPLIAFGKKWYKKRIFRISMSLYLLWSSLILFTHSELFEIIFDVGLYNIPRMLFLLTFPPAFIFLFIYTFRWCTRGVD